MFRRVLNSISLGLQGTPLEWRPKQRLCPSQDDGPMYSTEKTSLVPSYLITTEEYRIKNDLLSKLKSTDNSLSNVRAKANVGRAHWYTDNHQQAYILPYQAAVNPQVELYYKKLGLSQAR